MATEYITHVVDAGHIRNIGEQSISNKNQAVLELVKNAYDGDALTCVVRFYGERIMNGDTSITKIEIEDSGIGMTKNDIKNKLMKVGTPNKIDDTHSPKFGRRVSGAKGMGHYSMQRLGKKTIITTTPEQYPGREFYSYDNCTYVLEINWDEYVSGRNFQDISHKLTTQKRDSRVGTKIEIFEPNDLWNGKGNDEDLQKLSRTMGNIMLPKKLQKNKKDNFNPTIETVGFDSELSKPSGNLLNYASYKVDLSLKGNKMSLKIFRKNNDGKKYEKIHSKNDPTSAKCGDMNFMLYWFYSKNEKWAKGLFNSRELENQLKENHGIKIYNDNVRIMPYGEKGNDWLGLNARKAGPSSGGKVRNATLIGLIDLTREKNPQIIETTSREAIKKNIAFESLKDTIVEIIEELEEKVKEIVKQKLELEKKTNPANIALVEINRTQEIIQNLDSVGLDEKKTIDLKLTKIYKQIHIQEQQNQEIEEELTANIEMYRNLATVGIQTIAFNHEIINPVRFIKATLTNLDDLYNELSDKDKKKYISKSLERITHTLNWAGRIKEFSSILAGADNTKRSSTIDINKTLFELKDSLSIILDQLKITMNDPIIIGSIPDIKMNKASFESIFINLISNSVRALKKIRDKKKCIKMKIYTDTANIIFEFEDNGYGISDKDKDKIFRPFFTTYKNPVDRGTGMGLTIVKDIVEVDYHGVVKLKDTIYEDEHAGKGMTKFIIKLPLRERQTR